MLSKKEKKQFVKHTLKVTKLLAYEMINKKEDQANLFDELKLCLTAIEQRVIERIIK